MMKRNLVPLPLLLAAVGLSLACATTTDVDKKIAESQAKTDKKIESVETQFEDMQDKQKTTEGTVAEQGKQIEQISSPPGKRCSARRRQASSRRARSSSSNPSRKTACTSRSTRSISRRTRSRRWTSSRPRSRAS